MEDETDVSEGTFTFSGDGAAQVLIAALELLATIEDTDEVWLTDDLEAAARRMRAIVDEHVEVT